MKVLDLTQRLVGKGAGFVKLIDVLPRVVSKEHYKNGLLCDSAVVEAARVSYSNNKPKSSDVNLIKYLMKNSHTTPFEMVQFKFHIKAPLFVVRQWQRHRMSSYNEISGRYSVMVESFWEPEHFKEQGNSINKQGSGTILENSPELLEVYKNHVYKSYKLYKNLLGQGVSKELARTVLPLSLHTEFYWKIDLHNLLRFISLRSDPHAQEQIREYSDAIKSIVSEYCPTTVDAFDNYFKNSIKFSRDELEVLKTGDYSIFNNSKSSIKEFEDKIKNFKVDKDK